MISVLQVASKGRGRNSTHCLSGRVEESLESIRDVKDRILLRESLLSTVSVVDVVERAVGVVELEESERRSERDRRWKMEREVSLPAFLPALKDGGQRSEDLTDTILSVCNKEKDKED